MKKRIKVKSLLGTPFLISQQEQIGQGNFGRVVKAYKKDQPSKQLTAKIIPFIEQNKQTISAQMKILKQIPSHQNLVNCLKMQISTQHNFYLIMQYCNGGSFQKYIKNNHNCSQQIIWRFIKQFVKGYRILYDTHIIHRDIKPENILLHNGKIKIADFGLSRKIDHRNLMQNLSVKGTPLYIAPELQNQSQGNSQIDVFSFGIVIYRLAYNGEHPFYSNSQVFATIDEYFNHVNKTKLTFPKYPKRSDQLTELLQTMIEKDPAKRISWKKIFQHRKTIHGIKQPINNNYNQQLTQLKNSIIQIGRSAANLQQISQPFNHQRQIDAQMQRLMEFTQYLPQFEIRGLQIFAIRSKVIIQIIKYLNSLLKVTLTNERKTKITSLLEKISHQGFILCEHFLSKIIQIITKYQQDIKKNHDNTSHSKLITNLSKQRQDILKQLKIASTKYESLKYQNLLYDYLTQFNDLKKQQKQILKIPTALMIDLYDGLLKLQSMIKINQKQHIQIIDIQLSDNQLDKIDYQNLKSYQTYLEDINQITLQKIQKNLKSMGLIII